MQHDQRRAHGGGGGNESDLHLHRLELREMRQAARAVGDTVVGLNDLQIRRRLLPGHTMVDLSFHLHLECPMHIHSQEPRASPPVPAAMADIPMPWFPADEANTSLHAPADVGPCVTSIADLHMAGFVSAPPCSIQRHTQLSHKRATSELTNLSLNLETSQFLSSTFIPS
eukprot:764838-Hanusia_phi.AAC.3